ncbi:Antirestriction protein ArdC [Saccharicrinis carchari]|uniref:Antirestriction protein ArdC n=1 Tax=Saccharicrinis carchari TaxID=1168039 RepID=A0A521EZ46_SACCC|nr:zincin-like metallopeptidase domain-containing protein [Saccharicrinis carchari]SMO89106.1 Antirestriction protein ArdC [Saccharicrinis carchari]
MKTSKTVYDIINEKIFSQLEKGTIPWHKPWKSFDNDGNFVPPQNFVSRIPYKGINFVLLLNLYEQPYYLTWKQIQSLGGQIIKGEKSLPVVFWKPISKESIDKNGNPKTEKKFMFRYYNVFNITQTTGIDYEPVKFYEDTEPLCFDRIQKAEEVITGYKDCPKIIYGGNAAFYIPSLDKIHIPEPAHFDKPEYFYSTLFHEASHSVGHPSRLNRKDIADVNGQSQHDYSYEELIAEFSASYLSGHCGILQTTIQESAAYIHHWLTALKENTRWLVSAAGSGQKSAEYILGV